MKSIIIFYEGCLPSVYPCMLWM